MAGAERGEAVGVGGLARADPELLGVDAAGHQQAVVARGRSTLDVGREAVADDPRGLGAERRLVAKVAICLSGCSASATP
jgi:hypothetical protein